MLPGHVNGSEIHIRKRIMLLPQRRTKLKFAIMEENENYVMHLFTHFIKCLYLSSMPGKKTLTNSSMPV